MASPPPGLVLGGNVSPLNTADMSRAGVSPTLLDMDKDDVLPLLISTKLELAEEKREALAALRTRCV
jgi:hypothetical protein